MKRRILSILPTILFLGLLTALVSVRSATSAQSIHSMAVEPGYLAQARLSIKCNTLREDLSGVFQPRHFLGRLFNRSTVRRRSSSEIVRKSKPFG